MPKRSKQPAARDIAHEIIRRSGAEGTHLPDGSPRSYIIHMSSPPSAAERLQLIAARLLRTPVMIMPHRCKTTAEWLERYGSLKAPT